MKTVRLALFLFLLCFFWLSSSLTAKESSFKAQLRQTPWLGIEIWQSGKRKKLELEQRDKFAKRFSIEIETQEFEIRIPKRLIKKQGIQINTWLDDSVFESVRENKSRKVENTCFYAPKTFPHPKGEKDRYLIIALDSSHYLDQKHLKKVNRKQYSFRVLEIGDNSKQEFKLYSISKTPAGIKKLFLTIFIDRNQNKIVDADEFELIELQLQ